MAEIRGSNIYASCDNGYLCAINEHVNHKLAILKVFWFTVHYTGKIKTNNSLSFQPICSVTNKKSLLFLFYILLYIS